MRVASVIAFLVLPAGLGAGCDSLPPAPASSDGLLRTPRPPTTPPDMALPALVGMELSGRVTAPAVPAGRLVVLVTDGPCFRAGTHYHGDARPSADGSWATQVFPPSGTHVEVCAALIPAGTRSTAWWARAAQGPWTAQGRSRMKIAGIDLTISRADEVTVPSGIPLAP